MSQELPNAMNDQKINTFGARLKAAREAMHLDSKDAASQLRLNERVILMLESGHYDETLPITFLKGYIRSYAKLLQLSDSEIKQAVEALQPNTPHIDPALLPPAAGDITSRTYRMQFASALIGLTIVGLIGTWWHNHATTQTVTTVAAIPVALPETAAASAPTTIPLAPMAADPTLKTPGHPLQNTLAQQMSPPAPKTTIPEITKQSTPTPPKAAAAKPVDDNANDNTSDNTNDNADTTDDNNDNDQTD